MKWPSKSEIVCSAITIPDMLKLIRAHDLVPVPVDLDTETCAVDLKALQTLINPRTKAVLVAHVFGTRNSLDQVIQLMQQQKSKIFVLEDCAQAYAGGPVPAASHDADLSMYSFGTIKTSTAFGGSIVSISDEQVYAKMKTLEQTYPTRPRAYFLKRIIKYAVVHSLTTPAVFGLLLHACLKLNSKSACKKVRWKSVTTL